MSLSKILKQNENGFSFSSFFFNFFLNERFIRILGNISHFQEFDGKDENFSSSHMHTHYYRTHR